MAWWERNPSAWSGRSDLRKPDEAMSSYVAWLDGLDGKPVFVGFPASFDFMFVYWYLIRFAGRSPLSFAALDIKTMAMMIAAEGFPSLHEAELPEALVRRPPAHPHCARRRDRAGRDVLQHCWRRAGRRFPRPIDSRASFLVVSIRRGTETWTAATNRSRTRGNRPQLSRSIDDEVGNRIGR